MGGADRARFGDLRATIVGDLNDRLGVERGWGGVCHFGYLDTGARGLSVYED